MEVVHHCYQLFPELFESMALPHLQVHAVFLNRFASDVVKVHQRHRILKIELLQLNPNY